MSKYNESAGDYGTPPPQYNTPQPLPMDSELGTCFDRVRELIPNYEWTCFYEKSTGDLKHLPTGIVLTTDINGYEVTINHHYACYPDMTTFNTDPREAVILFVSEVVCRLARNYIEGKM